MSTCFWLLSTCFWLLPLKTSQFYHCLPLGLKKSGVSAYFSGMYHTPVVAGKRKQQLVFQYEVHDKAQKRHGTHKKVGNTKANQIVSCARRFAPRAVSDHYASSKRTKREADRGSSFGATYHLQRIAKILFMGDLKIPRAKWCRTKGCRAPHAS